MANNNRIYWAIEAVGIAPYGATSYTSVKGVRSLGLSTRFNLEQAFELGQINIYENIENIPDIEVTIDRYLDGNAPALTLATYGSTDASLVGRSNMRHSLAMSLYSDKQLSASGVPISSAICSGLYWSASTFTFDVHGPSTEQFTAVGNNKVWQTSNFSYLPNFTNNDTPFASGGIDMRWNFLMASAIFPNSIQGIVNSGNPTGADGTYVVKFQQIKPSVSLGRPQLMEIGNRQCFFRYVDFPIEVRTEYDVHAINGDLVNALELGTLLDYQNTSDESIYMQTQEGTKINCGSKNRLIDVRYGGANSGGRGSNATITYTYQGWNNFTVQHSQDPSPGLAF